MKKTGMIFTFAIFSILCLNFASAYFPGSLYLGRGGDIIDNIVTAGAPVLEMLFGGYTESVGEYSSGEILFIKFLLFLMMFVIIQTILKKIDLFKDNLAVVRILSVAIPLLSIRFMSANNLIYGIMLPYGTLGIVLTTILPFLIIFLGLHLSNAQGLARRIIWMCTITVYVVIWFNRAENISDLGNQIYFWLTVIMILMFILDKRIHSYFQMYETGKFIHNADQSHIASLHAEYLTLKNTPNYQQSKPIMKKLRDLEKELRSYGQVIP